MMSAERVHGAGGIARIVDAGRQTVGHLEPPLDLAQDQQPAVRGQPPAVEAGDNSLPATGDRPGSGRLESTMAGGRSETTWIGFCDQIPPQLPEWITLHSPASMHQSGLAALYPKAYQIG